MKWLDCASWVYAIVCVSSRRKTPVDVAVCRYIYFSCLCCTASVKLFVGRAISLCLWVEICDFVDEAVCQVLVTCSEYRQVLCLSDSVQYHVEVWTEQSQSRECIVLLLPWKVATEWMSDRLAELSWPFPIICQNMTTLHVLGSFSA